MGKIKALIDNKKLAPIIQFIKFGLVGVSNTAISYGTEMLCYYLLFKNSDFNLTVKLLSLLSIEASVKSIRIVYTSILAFIISVTNSYYWNNRFVFKSGNRMFKEHLKAYLKTVVCYGITGLVLSPIIKVLLSNAGVPYYIASLGSLVITIPLNFVLNKFWAFNNKKEENK